MTVMQDDDHYKELLIYFTEEFSPELLFGKIDPKDKKEKFLVEIFNRVNDVHSVFEKIDRYELYFDKFYPDPSIVSEAKAIEYHLYSYLQEIYSLNEKIIRLLNLAKNKAVLFNIDNMDDIYRMVSHIKLQIQNGLVQVLDTRGKHVHDKSVLDANIVKAKTLKVMVKLGLISELDAERKYRPLIDISKQKYISEAKKNKEEILRMKNFFAPRIGYLIAAFFGHDTSRFEKLISKES